MWGFGGKKHKEMKAVTVQELIGLLIMVEDKNQEVEIALSQYTKTGSIYMMAERILKTKKI